MIASLIVQHAANRQAYLETLKKEWTKQTQYQVECSQSTESVCRVGADVWVVQEVLEVQARKHPSEKSKVKDILTQIHAVLDAAGYDLPLMSAFTEG